MFGTFIFFVLVGIVALVARSRYTETSNTRVDMHKTFGIVSKVAFGLAVIFLVLSSAIVVPAGNVGVQVFFGNVQDDALESGFHVVNPLMEINNMDVRTQAYTMSAVHEEGQKQRDDAIEVLTSDGLTLKLEVTVQYRLLPSAAPVVYKSVGEDYNEKVVRPEIRSALRDKAVNYVSTDLYSIKREDFVARVKTLLEDAFKKRGLVLEGVLLRDVTLPQSVQLSINAKISAQQDAQKMEFVLQKESQEADRKRIEATEKLAESQNAKIIIVGNSKNGLPLVLSP